jgi:hypothetical protein
MSKGRHWAWGLLGFLTLFGLLILIIMPKNKRAMAAEPAIPTRTIARELLDERSAPSPPPPPPPTQHQTSKFFLHIGTEVKGPFTLEQIRGIISVGTASLNTQCCKEGTQEWRPVSAFV